MSSVFNKQNKVEIITNALKTSIAEFYYKAQILKEFWKDLKQLSDKCAENKWINEQM